MVVLLLPFHDAAWRPLCCCCCCCCQVIYPDLSPAIWTNPKEAAGTTGNDDDGNLKVDDVSGFDFYNNDATVYDGDSTHGWDQHGTHVSGTIGELTPYE
jgi:hypothetical protein